MDPNEKKKALRLLTYGLYVATSRDAQGYAAGTINWLSQSSFAPPLVMAGIQRDSSLHEAITHSGVFAIHVLGRSQKEMALRFFKGAEQQGETLNGFRFEPGATGAPVLLDPLAWLECRVGKPCAAATTASLSAKWSPPARAAAKNPSLCVRPASPTGAEPLPLRSLGRGAAGFVPDALSGGRSLLPSCLPRVL